jgi:LytS/YehU family sensor histidine kinase
VAAWESVAGLPHEPILRNSGATDANVLRMRGVPTARVGMPKVTRGLNGEAVDFTLGMNLVDRRIKIRYGAAYGIDVRCEAEHWTRVSIRVPVEQELVTC